LPKIAASSICSCTGARKNRAIKAWQTGITCAKLKKAVSIPVSGSGDVVSIEGALKKWRETNCDGILIGRGAMQNPWIFRQIEDVLARTRAFQPTLQDKQRVLLEYFEMLREDMPELAALGKMKQLAGQFTKGLIGGAQFRQRFITRTAFKRYLDNIGIYFIWIRSAARKSGLK
jgi:tRNA-dihydrouridine synthase B